jgi:uncharacterized protein (TIGR02246 family)
MTSDEREIRQLVATWFEATSAGDTDTVLGLMADDVVFLVTGRPPMVGKAAFAAAMRAPPGTPAPKIDGHSEVEEVCVAGDWACIRTRLTVTVTPPGGPPATRAGYTLSVLRKQDGRWVLARDANLLAPAPPARDNEPSGTRERSPAGERGC